MMMSDVVATKPCMPHPLTRAGIRIQMTEQVRVLGVRADRKLEMARDLSAFMQKHVCFS